MTATMCSGSHAYAPIGVPTISVTFTDDDGGSADDTIVLVVGEAQTKVTGGGWIKPDDAKLLVDPTATPGRAEANREIQTRWVPHPFRG